MPGIRVRITAVAMTVVTMVLVITGVALLSSQRRILTDNLDEILAADSRNIEAAVSAGRLGDPILPQGDEDSIAQVVDHDGHVLASTGNFATSPALAAPLPNATTFRTVGLPIDGSKFRLMSRSVNGVAIHTGTPLDDVDASVAALRAGLLAAVPAIGVLIGVLVWWLVGRTLRPVEAIRAQVAGITGASLDQRVPEPAGNDEIARLARTMNKMLERVEDASERQQRFVSDASHELRSPITRIQSELEVDLAHPETADLLATHRSVLEEAGALHRLVEDLLHLARSASHTGQREQELIDIDDLMLVEAQRLRARTNCEVDTSRISAAQVSGVRAELERVIRNLCDNAARHATGRITLASGERGGTALVSVADDGPGIPEHERSRVFERFARLDESRHAASGGTGLGLAITLDIVQRHGGSITVEEPENGGVNFIVCLPAKRPAPT